HRASDPRRQTKKLERARLSLRHVLDAIQRQPHRHQNSKTGTVHPRAPSTCNHMRIGYLIANFPVLSETFVVNDIRGLEALGHEVVAIALGKPDPATLGNPNYQI